MKLARFISQFLLVACLGPASGLVCAASPAADEQTQIDRNRAREIYGRFQSTGLIPLDQMTSEQKHKGEDGGLYGGGKNQPPPQHRKAAEIERDKIVPLDSDGQPKPDGMIVLLSIGMSNTTQEFLEVQGQGTRGSRSG